MASLLLARDDAGSRPYGSRAALVRAGANEYTTFTAFRLGAETEATPVASPVA